MNDPAVAAMIQSFGTEGQNQEVFGQPGQQQTPQIPQPMQQPQPVYAQQAPAPQGAQAIPQAPLMPQQPMQQPQGLQPEYPVMAPQAPIQDPNAVPAWAQGLIQEVQELKQQPPAPTNPGDWQPSSFADIDKRINEKAEEIAAAKLQDFQTQQQQAKQQEEAALAEANRQIDMQLASLQQTGYLPQIANPNDPNDPGKQAQQELIAYSILLGTDNIAAVAPQLKMAHDAGYFYDYRQQKMIRRGSQTAAASAPIAGASPTTGSYQTGPTQSQLATMSMDQLMNLGLQSIQ